MAPGACARVRQGFHRLKYMFVNLLRLKPAAAGVLGWKQNIVCFLSKAQFIISSKKKKNTWLIVTILFFFHKEHILIS
jgi:hypothetical protein